MQNPARSRLCLIPIAVALSESHVVASFAYKPLRGSEKLAGSREGRPGEPKHPGRLEGLKLERSEFERQDEARRGRHDERKKGPLA